jgi:hypothetical protein
MTDLEWHENKKLRRLEVAAPEMLKALKAVLDHLHIAMQGPDWSETAILDAFDVAQDAINAAEGEA